VGEMRDQETVATGIEASLTGHLVFSTLHTNSAPETITRLLDMGMDPFNFADAMLGVLAQRLVRTLCKDCKVKYQPTREEYDSLVRAYGSDFDSLGFPYNDDLALFKPNGCNKCGNTGYRGRIGVYELLQITDDKMKDMITSGFRKTALEEYAKQHGFRTLKENGFKKALKGVTTLEEVLTVTEFV